MHTKAVSNLQKHLPSPSPTTKSNIARHFLLLLKHVSESSPLYHLHHMQLAIRKQHSKNELGGVDHLFCTS